MEIHCFLIMFRILSRNTRTNGVGGGGSKIYGNHCRYMMLPPESCQYCKLFNIAHTGMHIKIVCTCIECRNRIHGPLLKVYFAGALGVICYILTLVECSRNMIVCLWGRIAGVIHTCSQ